MSRGTTVKTPERVAEAQRMRSEGMLLREIAAHFGVGRSAVATWISDPNGARLKARKDSYAQPCMDCGGPTSGCQGRREEPRCHPCAAIASGAARKAWTRAAILIAIAEWVHEHGAPPAKADWDPYQALHSLHDEARARRFQDADGAWPHTNTVIREFGTWNAAIEAAGFKPRAAHGGDGNELRRRSAERA